MSTFEPFRREGVRGFLHRPGGPSRGGVVLAHGAGANCESKLLVAVSVALSDAGFSVLRLDLPFRQKRPSGPPFPGAMPADMDGLREALDIVREIGPGPVVLGGHSYGGRVATMLAAEDFSLADTLLLLSYPLHPPMKRDQLRTAHFPQVRTPALFVHGTRDAFGLPEEMRQALKLLGGPVLYEELQGAGHDLRSGKFDVDAILVQPLLKLLTTNGEPADTA